MKLRSIETTPSPNCMKLNLDAQVSAKPLTINMGDRATDTPDVFQKLLAIKGIQSIFAASDFVTLTRRGGVDWQPILMAAGEAIGIAEDADDSVSGNLQSGSAAAALPVQNFGQVDVAIQLFRGIPVQVRATKDVEQARVALPDRFNQALQRAIVATGADYVAERIWSPYQPQFGEPSAIASQVAHELDILTSDRDLIQLEQKAINPRTIDSPQNTTASGAVQAEQQALVQALQASDWKQRLKAIQQIEVDAKTFPAVKAALQDERSAIRRWAAALLGASERAEAVEPLCQVLLTDASPIVRRTAGDALSDLGDAGASEAMMQALQDASGLVRWRAGRFLNEMGDARAVVALEQAAKKEQAFDVRVEMRAAIARIQSGESALLPMWMRISQQS